jgi:hypothetical protein
VVLYAVAARDATRAEAFAKKHGFQKSYGGETGYQGCDILSRIITALNIYIALQIL